MTDSKITTGRKAERGDILRYLKRRAEDYSESAPATRLIIREIMDEIKYERHRNAIHHR